MNADWAIVQGDTAPAYPDVLSFDDGTAANLAGATVQFGLRSLTSNSPIALTGIVTVTGASTGAVQFTPSALDTAVAGNYMAQWVVTFLDGSRMTFPTEGYLSVQIEENLASAGGQQLVSLPDVKDYLSITASDRSRDAKLVRWIRAIRPLVENITGPIIQASFDEWHDGGGSTIQIRRRPSSSFGTSPVLTLTAVSEYSGVARYPLTIVTEPSLSGTYGCTIDPIGTITRRGAGGIASTFGPNGVHVTYLAGQSSIPANVYEGALELLRANYETTQMRGGGLLASSDDLEAGLPLRSFVPRRVREILAPNGRAPSIA